jgi:hypothetical protein
MNVGQDGMSEVRWQDVFIMVVDDESGGGSQSAARQPSKKDTADGRGVGGNSTGTKEG